MRDSYIVNAEFEGLRAADLVDDSLNNWCHHVQYILPQVLLPCDKEWLYGLATVGKVYMV